MDAFHRTDCVDAPNAFGGWTEQTRCISGITAQNHKLPSSTPQRGANVKKISY